MGEAVEKTKMTTVGDVEDTGQDGEAVVEVKPGVDLPVNFALKLEDGPRWRMIRTIGAGNFGQVMAVARKVDGKKTKWEVGALKTGIGRNASQIRWEGQVLAYLKLLGRTEGIIQMICCGEAEDVNKTSFPYVLIEILHPTFPTLQQLVKVEDGHRLDVGKACRVGIQMLAGLENLHSLGILHRDLKPENVGILAIPNHHRCVLIDLGMAGFFTDTKGDIREPRSYPGQKGTPTFMSHRVTSWREAGRVDDLWSWFAPNFIMFQRCNVCLR